MKKKLYKNKSFDDLVNEILNTKSTLVPKEVLLKDLYDNHKDIYKKQYISPKKRNSNKNTTGHSKNPISNRKRGIKRLATTSTQSPSQFEIS